MSGSAKITCGWVPDGFHALRTILRSVGLKRRESITFLS